MPQVVHPPGFILVGVAMFVLVLTILGLSLFSLSGFESQFYERSKANTQSFYYAVGAIDRIRFALKATGRLEDAQAPLPPYVVEANAYQWQGGPDTLFEGTIQWGGEDVLIRATSEFQGSRSTVEGRFVPEKDADPYKRLMTFSGADTGLRVITFDQDGSRRDATTYLDGTVWQNAASPGAPCDSFQNVFPNFSWSPPGGVEAPDLVSYFAAFFKDETPSPELKYEQDGSIEYKLDAKTATRSVGAGFFKTEWPGGAEPWSLGIPEDASGSEVRIRVEGRAIWMFDHGLWCRKKLRIEGDSKDMLILVARPGTDPDHVAVGLSLMSAIRLARVPVMLITDGRIEYMQDENPEKDTSVSYLSMFAKGAILMGPRGGHSMIVSHDPNSPNDKPNGAIDQLLKAGLLPNATGANPRAITLRPGTWLLTRSTAN